MEQRKHQFLGFVVILLMIGFLNYFRRILYKHNEFTRAGKILYLITMITFIISIMFVLYFTEVNNLISFCVGLCVATLSEYIAKLFIVVGDNFGIITGKIIKKTTGIDLTHELTNEQKIKNEPKDVTNINQNKTNQDGNDKT